MQPLVREVDLRGHAFDILKFCTYCALHHASPVPDSVQCIHEMQIANPELPITENCLGAEYGHEERVQRQRENELKPYPEKPLKKGLQLQK